MKAFRKVIAIMMSVSIVFAVMTGCSVQTAENAKLEELSKTSVENFNSINLDVNVATVDIIPEADEFAIEYHIENQDVDYSVKDGMLTFNAKGSSNNGINLNERSYVKIYVPSDSEFSVIDCKCNVGDINIEKIKVDNMTLNTAVGNVTLQNIEVNENLDVETNVGNVDTNLTNADCSYDIATGVGKILINGAESSGLDVKKNDASAQGPQVNINTDTGNISFNFNS